MENEQRNSPTGHRNVGVLIEEAKQELIRRGYSTWMVKYYPRTWKRFARFAGQTEFSDELADLFLSHLGIPKTPSPSSTSYQNRIRLAMKLLSNYHAEGIIRWTRFQKAPPSLSGPMEEILASYQRFLLNHQRVRPATVKNKVGRARNFLLFLNGRGDQCIEDIQSTDLSEYVRSLSHYQKTTLSTTLLALKAFLNYLWTYGFHKEKLSRWVPKVRLYQDLSIPIVYSAEEVQCILGKIDRGSPIGKRDYAIILLAYRLGLRASDIAQLKLDNLHWEQSKIFLHQVKTDKPLELPLLQEVGDALIEYLKYGRPQTPYREIFLTARAPLRPFLCNRTVTLIFKKYRFLSEIAVPRRGGGIHALRNSLASQMLRFGVPLKTISDVLGHSSTDSTHGYLKVDFSALQKASLNPDEVEAHHE